MKRKATFSAILMVSVLFISGCLTDRGDECAASGVVNNFDECIAAGNPAMESYPRQCMTRDGETFTEEIEVHEEPIIGGDRDEYGCLGSAGYTWNEDVGACIRTWELDDNQKIAASLAVDEIKDTKSITIIEILTARCPGCFSVKLEEGEERNSYTVTIDNWLVTEYIVTVHTCTDAEKAAEMCTMEYVPVCGWSELMVSKTYGNACSACSAGSEYWEAGECETNGMSPQECIDMDGRTLNIVAGDTCEENELNAGIVQGFISPNICCVPA